MNPMVNIKNHDRVSAPITRLQPELLSLIFLENTSPNSDHDQLRTACSSSQVCQQWRNTIVSLASLWGRLIDMDTFPFDDVNSRWRHELLRRTGSALLWIKGSVRTVERQKLFLSFLEQNWTRVERIDVLEEAGDPILRLKRWKGLESRAPNLKSFVLRFQNTDPSLFPEIEQTTSFLFKDGAPLLQEICASDIKFDTRSSWLPNIRNLTLSTHYSIQEIFEILRATPELTNLRITAKKRGEYESQPNLSFGEYAQNHITLPHLETFFLESYLNVSLPFFQYLDFPASCSPSLRLTDISHWDMRRWTDSTFLRHERATLEIIRERMVELFRKYLALGPTVSVTRIQVDCPNFETKLDFSSGPGGTVSGGFDLKGQLGGAKMLEDLALCNRLRSVKQIELDIHALPFQALYLAELPSSLRSLTTLVTDETTLSFFLDINHSEVPGCLPFPSLKVLKLRGDLNTGFSPIWSFLQLQIDGDSPISVFDLTPISFNNLPDFDFLDSIPGLEIHWICGETRALSTYKCGSGQPDILKFYRTRLRLMKESRRSQQRNLTIFG